MDTFIIICRIYLNKHIVFAAEPIELEKTSKVLFNDGIYGILIVCVGVVHDF